MWYVGYFWILNLWQIVDSFIIHHKLQCKYLAKVQWCWEDDFVVVVLLKTDTRNNTSHLVREWVHLSEDTKNNQVPNPADWGSELEGKKLSQVRRIPSENKCNWCISLQIVKRLHTSMHAIRTEELICWNTLWNCCMAKQGEKNSQVKKDCIYISF